MITHTRKGSKIHVHVNGDWSGDALITSGHALIQQGAAIPAMSLLLGKVGDYLGHDLTPDEWCEAVSIAVEAYMTDRARLLLDDLHIARTGVASKILVG